MKTFEVYLKNGAKIEIDADDFTVNHDFESVFFEDNKKQRYNAVFTLNSIFGFKEICEDKR